MFQMTDTINQRVNRTLNSFNVARYVFIMTKVEGGKL